MAFITKSVKREKLEASVNNIIMLMALYRDRASNFPNQEPYWLNRISELDDALSPMLDADAKLEPTPKPEDE